MEVGAPYFPIGPCGPRSVVVAPGLAPDLGSVLYILDLSCLLCHPYNAPIITSLFIIRIKPFIRPSLFHIC